MLSDFIHHQLIFFFYSMNDMRHMFDMISIDDYLCLVDNSKKRYRQKH